MRRARHTSPAWFPSPKPELQSQHFLRRAEPDQGPPESLADRRKGTDAYTARAKVDGPQVCPNQLVDDKIAGVPVRIVTPSA